MRGGSGDLPGSTLQEAVRETVREIQMLAHTHTMFVHELIGSFVQVNKIVVVNLAPSVVVVNLTDLGVVIPKTKLLL